MALKVSEKSNDTRIDETQEKFTDYMNQDWPGTAYESSGNCSQCQLIKFEYHVLYHISYAVPYLCFNAYKSSKIHIRVFCECKLNFLFSSPFFEGGALLTLDDAWELFRDHMSNDQLDAKNQLNMLNILTQMEHPVLFKPFLTLHPCRIAEVLSQLPNSENKVLSFLSTYGPSVFLTLDPDYAKNFNQFENNKENGKS